MMGTLNVIGRQFSSKNVQSKYENYTKASNFYDQTRVAVGIDKILTQLDNPAEATVLDAGCGTGNYTF